MNQRLEIPKDVDPQWASIIESCCNRYLICLSCLNHSYFLDGIRRFENKTTIKRVRNGYSNFARAKIRYIVNYSEPANRPSFQVLIDRLRELQRKYAIQLQAARSGGDNNHPQKET